MERAAQTKVGRASRASRAVTSANPANGDWREEILTKIRRLIRETGADIVEERKWIKPSNPSGVAVWSQAGIICTGEVYKQVVKLTFSRGASLPDPNKLFNSSLAGNARRAIDIREGEEIDTDAFKALLQAAVAENLRLTSAKTNRRKKVGGVTEAIEREAKPSKAPKGEKVVLLSGGNPQIAKADGDAPVQAYIAAMPGWKSEFGKRLDALIVRQVPNVGKAVRWNSPFYGIQGQGWFLSFHVFTRYVKVTFFAGSSLRPVPPGGTPKSKEVRWIDIYEDDEIDETDLASWVQQASLLPGWLP